jgi:hypothetical protein
MIFKSMLNKTMTKVFRSGGDTLTFQCDNGTTFKFLHDFDCCESVYIEDVCGDLNDLVGSPILMAEEISCDKGPPKHPRDECYRWTFYKFATAKGWVTVRWLGQSNGYYSMGVSFYENGKRKRESNDGRLNWHYE